jgi:transmembrane 9 superfamily protein 2/4
MLLGGILPFGCCFTELDHVMGSAWMGMWYNTFGFLLVTLVLMLTTCAVITVLLAYFQLNRENYRWWWRSFANAGAASLYIFAYSIQYFRRFESTAVGTSVLYFGYMGLASLAVFLAMGSVGVASTLWFSKALFAYGRDKEIWIEIDRDQSSVLPKDDVRVVSHDPMIVTIQTTWPLSELPEG